MSGLVLKIAPGERFIINGAILENGDKSARIRVTEKDVRVLRCRDALKFEDVDTPVKQIYYAVQLLITGDLEPGDTIPAIDLECRKLIDVFLPFDSQLIPVLRSMVSCGNYYSALRHLRQMLTIESELMKSVGENEADAANKKVA